MQETMNPRFDAGKAFADPNAGQLVGELSEGGGLGGRLRLDGFPISRLDPGQQLPE